MSKSNLIIGILSTLLFLFSLTDVEANAGIKSALKNPAAKELLPMILGLLTYLGGIGVIAASIFVMVQRSTDDVIIWCLAGGAIGGAWSANKWFDSGFFGMLFFAAIGFIIVAITGEESSETITEDDNEKPNKRK